MTHYSTLGLEPSATPDEVRQAYRRSSSRAHPDKGGDHTQMAKVNEAYAVLSDPARRERYDATGQDDQQPTLHDAARNLVLQLLAEAIAQDGDCVRRASDMLEHQRRLAAAEQTKVQAQLKRLRKRRPMVSVESGDNLVHMLIDQQLAVLGGKSSQLEQWQTVAERAQQLLSTHTWLQPAAQHTHPEFVPFERSTLWGTQP